mgnify:CR=1 FL=1
MSYTFSQWILVFYTYCFFGWVWESCYVSAKQRHWVNRGFLYGPWLPIYGSGAVVILLATLRFQDNLYLVYLAGMAAATLLELVTGWAMEQIFHMRYWDYSKQPLNLNGYVCVPVSLGWGVFSVLLVRVIHPQIDKLVALIPISWDYPLSLVLTVLFAVDTTKSVQAVLDTKELLQKLTQSSHTVARINGLLNEGSEHFAQLKRQLEQSALLYREHKIQPGKDALPAWLTERRNRRGHLLSNLGSKTDALLEQVRAQLAGEVSSAEREKLEKKERSLADFQALLTRAEAELAERKNRDFRQAVSILRRNPTATSRKYPLAFSQIRKLKERTEKKQPDETEHSDDLLD